MRKQKRNIVGCCIGLLAMCLLSIVPVTEASPVVIASYTGPTNYNYYVGYGSSGYITQSIGQSFIIPQFPVGNSCIIKEITLRLGKSRCTSNGYLQIQVWKINEYGIPFISPYLNLCIPASSITTIISPCLKPFTIISLWNIQFHPGNYAIVLTTFNVEIAVRGLNGYNLYSGGALLTQGAHYMPWIVNPTSDLSFLIRAEPV